jgi:hypothetical protein
LTILFFPRQPVDARAAISRKKRIREELNDANQVMEQASRGHEAFQVLRLLLRSVIRRQ